jgi:dipeptidyl aminopeptidase/acylaminoacyl peptidase
MNKRLGWIVLALALISGRQRVSGGGPEPEPALEQVLDTLFQVQAFKETAISPDGKHVAWVQAAGGHSAIYVADWQNAGAGAQRIAAGDGKTAHDEHSLAWSPDGERLAFLSDRDKPGQLQLYVASAPAGKMQRLTNLTGFLAHPRWSPDAKRLAFLFTENASRAAGPVQAGTRAVGVIEEHVEEQRLSVLDLQSGKTRLLSPPDLYVYEYDWSPDGKHLAAIAAHGAGDNNWYIAKLYTLSVATGTMKAIWSPRMQMAVPRWSPDGSAIAVIAGLISDEGIVGGDIFAVPVTPTGGESATGEGGKARNVTPRMKASASWLIWPDSKHIIFTEHIDGGSGLARLDLDSGKIATLWKAPETIHAEGGAFSVSLSRDGKIGALVRQSFERAPEIWAGPVGNWKQLTRANAKLLRRWGEMKSLHWKSDGWMVQGWLLFPGNYDPRWRYPLVVSVHGGPASAKRPAWPGTVFDPSVYASQGYFVLFPNPRGSFGQGEDFTRANVKDLGHGDLRDILAGVDEVLRQYPIDKERLAIAGWSYGGYMTMWAVTQTNRFRAAIAGAGIANWQSYYGQNGIDQWLIPYFGASVYDDPATYARSSPINFIKRVKTPTLILVGERDLECPVPQSQEFWHALKTLRVPTQFVVYADEGHLIANPEHRRDIARRSVGWLNKHVSASTPASKRR